MDRSMKIEDFHSLLTSDDSALLTALRELRVIERLDDIVTAISDVAQEWNEI